MEGAATSKHINITSPILILLLFSILVITTTAIGTATTLTQPKTSSSSSPAECTYGIYVQTGSVQRAGTHSVIGLSLWDESGSQIAIPNLETWGLMGPGFNYFETGELNIFGVRGPCLAGGVCGINLTSDGSGPYHGWYCDYVQITSFGLGIDCSQQMFHVEQWLARDEPPYQLTATRDLCKTATTALPSYSKSI
ncbi:PLAT domain-containing protein 3-like isoform X2 [Andrographis paniculata]|uniref:PLAT domain-containing protein 3-like isoform X2 n=1 Tax=Andrographis paniculata TaxID=175694 RepID=UPI0021E8DCAE|nr:PLAT domain-containing protein 3-like isoform X2 [Andrographis paniculata]